MEKNPKNQRSENRNTIFGIKWEFLRRNKKYIQEYNNYIATCRKIQEKAFSSNPKLGAYKKEQLRFFKLKYGIKIPKDPNISFFKLRKSLKKPFWDALDDDWNTLRNDMRRFDKRNKFHRKVNLKNTKKAKKNLPSFESSLSPEKPNYLSGKYKAILLHTVVHNFISRDSAVISLDEYVENSSDKEFKKALGLETMKVTINSNAPIKKIIKDMGWMIKSWYQFRNRATDNTQKRLRLKKYETYLQIYDLRKQQKTYREIARIVYKDEYDKYTKYTSKKYDIQPLTEKVKNNLKACRKLIDGDYDYKIIR